MARRGRQIGDRRDNFSRQSFFLLAMATKTVAAWSAVNAYKIKHDDFKRTDTGKKWLYKTSKTPKKLRTL